MTTNSHQWKILLDKMDLTSKCQTYWSLWQITFFKQQIQNSVTNLYKFMKTCWPTHFLFAQEQSFNIDWLYFYPDIWLTLSAIKYCITITSIFIWWIGDIYRRFLCRYRIVLHYIIKRWYSVYIFLVYFLALLEHSQTFKIVKMLSTTWSFINKIAVYGFNQYVNSVFSILEYESNIWLLILCTIDN